MRLRSWAAVVVAAVALVAVLGSGATADVTVTGLPPWLDPVAEKTLSAVWSEIMASGPGLDMVETLRMVIPKLLKGYEISLIKAEGQNVFLSFKNPSKVMWNVELSLPSIDGLPLQWFKDDTKGLADDLYLLVSDLPLGALSWADRPLKQRILSVVEKLLPGWKPDVLIRLNEAGATLSVGFTPSPPLVLALNPIIDSGSLPIIAQNELKEHLLTGQSGLIGLPVLWSEHHKSDIETEMKAFLLDKNVVDRTKSEVEVKLAPGQISKINAKVESLRYSLYAWFAAYAGTDDKYGEFGLHLGRRAQLFPWWDVELYGEFITEVNDFDVESRLGMMWTPHRKIWIGGEFSTEEDEFWWRVFYQGGYDKPYFVWRYSEDSDHDWGIGWKFNQFFSLELHYDGRDEDSFSLKVINNL